MILKPFIRWAGGKQKLLPELIKHAPKEDRIGNYFEPFLGAGSLFFANGFGGGVISDVNFQLINSYRRIKEDYKCVHKLIHNFNNSFQVDYDFYYLVREEFNKEIEESSAMQAARFVFLINTNFNGIYRVNKKGHYNVPIGKLKPVLPSLNQLELISLKLKKTDIRCQDFNNSSSEIGCHDFAYIDPPYPSIKGTDTPNQYTICDFDLKKHIEVSEFAKRIDAKGSFVMISYPDTKFIRHQYKDWNIKELSVFRSISCKKERLRVKELIIKNY